MLDINEKGRVPAPCEGASGGRLLYPDLLRALLAFAVVVIHTVYRPWDSLTPDDSAWQTLSVINSFFRFCIPAFVMLSGMFFLDPAKNVTTEKIYKKSLPRIAAAYCFWSFVYAAVENIALHGVSNSSLLKRILHDFAKGHFTLWFLIMLAGLYIITPLLRIITKHASKAMLEYFLLLSFIFAGVLPTFLTLLKVLGVGAAREIAEYYSINLNIHFVLGFTGCYIAGYYFRVYSLSKRSRRVLYALGILGIAAAISMTLILSKKKGYPVQLFWEYLAPNVTLIAYAVFVFVKEHSAWLEKRPKAIAAVRYVSSCTFGIYLVHDLINIALIPSGFSILNYPFLLSAPLYSVFVFALSLAVVSVLKKIPIVNKYLI